MIRNLGFLFAHRPLCSPRAPIFLVLCGALASACGDSSPDDPPDGAPADGGSVDSATGDAAAPTPDAPSGDPGLCADRTGGALITLGNPPGTKDGPDQIVLWITDSAFIDEAIQHQASGGWRVAAIAEVIPGTDCDPTHPWHIDPARATWYDVSREECDATVTYVTENLEAWTSRPTPDWCPWSGVVVEVDDRRSSAATDATE